jgi:hypothetical protein
MPVTAASWTRSALPAVAPVVAIVVIVVPVVAIVPPVIAIVPPVVAIVVPVVVIVPSEGREAGTYRDRQGADSGQEKRSPIHVPASW